MEKQQRITIETIRELKLTLPRSYVSRCEMCGADTLKALVDQAAILSGVGSRAVFRWVESGELHYEESCEGLLFVCLASLYHLAPSDSWARRMPFG